MSKTTTTTATATNAPSGAALVHVDPATLVIETNVRTRVDLDEAFVASIAARGILEPVVAHRREDGALAVLYGQRRTLAAVRAEQAVIPVYLVPTPTEADRVVDQMGENDHRSALSTGERVAGFAQLAALGLSAGQIAAKTATKRAHVQAAITTSASATATEAANRYTFLTLEQSAVLAEFDAAPEVVEALVAAAQRGGFEHAAQRARDEQARTALRQDAEQELTDAGITVIPSPAYDATVKHLSQLVDAQGKTITAGDHATCPGHAACVRLQFDWITEHPGDDSDSESEDSQEEADDDQDERDQEEDGEDEQDGEEVPTARQRCVETMVAVYLCREPAKHGHRLASAARATARVPASDLSETERAEQAAQRREVIECNKAWISAQKVRRAWMTTFAARKAAPKNAAQFIAATITGHPALLARAMDYRNTLAYDLLGHTIDAASFTRPALVSETTTAARAQVVTVVVMLAAYEEATARDDWRRVSPATTRYLRYIASQGYPLADVERRACGEEPASTAEQDAEQSER